MNKNSRSRAATESAEELKTTGNDVPDNRLQAEQQIADTETAEQTKPAEGSFTLKKQPGKGSQLKQEKVADMLTGASSSAGMGINAAGRSVSGTVGGVLGANNSTPIAGKSRSDTRVGKKLDRVATKLNYTPSEQVIIDFDESKPLADAADADQGYNGTYRNEFARSQKIYGAVPGDLLFMRSVDFIMKDKLYFVEGQQVFQNADDRTALNPTLSGFNEDIVGQTHSVTYHSGNYLHRGLHFGLDRVGRVKYFFADVIDLTVDPVDPDIANASSAARLIKSNIAELDRQVMDSKAGDEKADIWSPLPRAVPQPTQTLYLLSSIEADTGAFVYLAYSKATTNFSFQLNRGPKDGLSEVVPAIEQCVGWRLDGDSNCGSNSPADVYSLNLSNVFNADDYDKGDPSLMIAAYDSTAKFKNKADLLLQPRGFRMHLQTADNNMNPLHIPSQLAAVYTGQEVFSTIDHDYDPLLPICFTDKANFITVHNWNELAGFMKVFTFKMTYTSTNIAAGYKHYDHIIIPKGIVGALGYENLYVLYKKSAGDGLVAMTDQGVIVLDPDNSNGEKVIDIIISTKNAEAGYTLVGTVPANFAHDVIVQQPKTHAAETGDATVVTDSKWQETDTGAVLYYKGAGPFTYAYSDLRNNYFVDVKHPLLQGVIDYLEQSIGGKFFSLLGARKELYVPMIFSTQYMTLAQLIFCAATPWITRARINSMRDVLYYEENVHQYPFSKLNDLKNVPFHNYVNFGFHGYDEPLEVKVMNPVVAMQWVMPEFVWKIDTYKYVLPWYFNENELLTTGAVDPDAACMSFPSIRSGVRLSLLDNFYGMSEKDVRLSLDRMTKYFIGMHTHTDIGAYKYGRTTDGQPYVVLNNEVITIWDCLACPRELGLCMDAPIGVLTREPGQNLSTALTDEASSAFRIKVFTNPNTLVEPTILAADGVNIARAANYTQKWLQLFASCATSNTVMTGLVFGMNDEGAAQFTPFAVLGTGAAAGTAPATIVSLQRSMWTRLQMLPFVISPFDGHATSGADVRDIYDIAYMFGLSGFRASDYRESVYNREKEVVNQGLLFVDDPWVLDSPIVKNGASASGQSVTKGFELGKH